MKAFNKEESMDKLLAYYGDAAALTRTRKRIASSNWNMFLLTLVIAVALSFGIVFMIGKYEIFYTVVFYISLLTCIPALGALVIEYMFIVLEDCGHGIAIGFGILYLVLANFIESYSTNAIITLLLFLLFCQWYSKEQFTKVVDNTRCELLRNNVNVEIVNNKVIFK